MFGVDSSELFLIILVAVVVIGPKDLPRVMRTVGHWVGKARGMASQFRLGVDQMMRETEIADLEKKWREQNEAIMKAHPFAAPDSDWGKPAEIAAGPAQPIPSVTLLKEIRQAPVPPVVETVPSPAALGNEQAARPGRRAPRLAPTAKLP